jgi:hypothetical protein
MVFIRILQRKDATSVIVAVALGLALAQFMSVVALGLSSLFSTVINGEIGIKAGSIYDWRASLFEPAMLFILQVAVLEVLARIVILFRKLVISYKNKS